MLCVHPRSSIMLMHLLHRLRSWIDITSLEVVMAVLLAAASYQVIQWQKEIAGYRERPQPDARSRDILRPLGDRIELFDMCKENPISLYKNYTADDVPAGFHIFKINQLYAINHSPQAFTMSESNLFETPEGVIFIYDDIGKFVLAAKAGIELCQVPERQFTLMLITGLKIELDEYERLVNYRSMHLNNVVYIPAQIYFRSEDSPLKVLLTWCADPGAGCDSPSS